jgi:hypothetical protein
MQAEPKHAHKRLAFVTPLNHVCGSEILRAIEWWPQVGFHFCLVLRSPFKLQSKQRSGAFRNTIQS